MSKRFDALMARERAVQRILDQVNAQADAIPNAAPELPRSPKQHATMLPPGTRVDDWFTPEHRSKTLIEF